MLENFESLTIIICTIIGTAIATVSAIFSIQKSFRNHIDKLFESYDENIKSWINISFEQYYIPIDNRLKNLNYRIKELEKK